MEASSDHPEPQWPLAEALDQLEARSAEDIRGTERLGSLAFDQAPAKVDEIVGILRDLREEDWDTFDDSFRAAAQGQANALVGLLTSMEALTAGESGAPDSRTQFERQLNDILDWFRAQARPRALGAQVRRELERQRVFGEGDTRNRAALEKELSELRAQTASLRRELETIEPVVEAGRAAAGQSGATDLAADYLQQARDHRNGWQTWQWIFLAAVVLAIGGSVAVVAIHHPSGQATTAAAVSRFLIDILVIGVLLYLVRLASLQFRVHRHLEAVSRSKAAALATFGRIVASGAEPATRDALATTLAQAVFAPGDTGFIDATSDHITLIERVAAPVAQRLAPPS